MDIEKYTHEQLVEYVGVLAHEHNLVSDHVMELTKEFGAMCKHLNEEIDRLKEMYGNG